MKAQHLPLFCAPGGGAPIAFEGERAGDELLDGALLAEGEEVGRVAEGLASFMRERVNWPPEEIDRLKAEGWIPRNWENEASHAAHTPARGALCDQLTALEGVVLEGATGPGGGNMPPVLQRKPSASLIVNDISPDVLRLWQAFLQSQGLGAQLSFAAFDARRMPIRSESLAAVSGQACFGEVGGLEVFDETWRVLRPGGVVCAGESIVDPTDWARMPADRRAAWEERIPGMTVGVAGLLEQHGFQIVSRELVPGRALVPEEGGLPKDASEYGVTLHVVFEYVQARKRWPHHALLRRLR